MYLRRVIQDAFRRLGWEVRRTGYPGSEEELLARFLRVVRPDTVFDIGANVGQYAASLRTCGFTGRIVSFEALPDVHATLAARAKHDPAWTVAPQGALGREAGEARMHVAVNSVSSSLLPTTDLSLQAAPDSRDAGRVTVPVRRLDALAATLGLDVGRLMLKIDTQGFEAEVLAGAGDVLASTVALQVELSLAPLYEGAPDLRRMLDVCDGLGFDLPGLIPGFCQPDGRRLQVVGLFVKRPAA